MGPCLTLFLDSFFRGLNFFRCFFHDLGGFPGGLGSLFGRFFRRSFLSQIGRAHV